jgi:hypothetical protein
MQASSDNGWSNLSSTQTPEELAAWAAYLDPRNWQVIPLQPSGSDESGEDEYNLESSSSDSSGEDEDRYESEGDGFEDSEEKGSVGASELHKVLLTYTDLLNEVQEKVESDMYEIMAEADKQFPDQQPAPSLPPSRPRSSYRSPTQPSPIWELEQVVRVPIQRVKEDGEKEKKDEEEPEKKDGSKKEEES